MSDSELLEPRGMTSTELAALVKEYLDNGGKVKKCEEGVALNFRVSVLEVPEEAKKIQVIKKNKKGKKQR